MLQCTKYSRLRSDSLSSLEDRSQETDLSAGADLGLNPHSHLAPLDVRSPPARGESTLRGFIPRMASISLLGLRGHAHRHHGDRDADTEDRRVDGLWTGSWSDPRSQTSFTVPVAQQQSALRDTKRPITLHRAASVPWTTGCPLHSQGDTPPGWETPLGAEESGGTGREHTSANHHVKYVGSLEVTQSMRTLDFEKRMQVTREAISRLCPGLKGVKTAVKSKRPLQTAPCAVLGQSNLQFSGSGAVLTVCTDSMTLTTARPLQTIAHHSMQSISFASGGDSDMSDFIAYVAKDSFNRRACYIIKCPSGRAVEVINSIGRAFETCFRKLLSQSSPLLPTMPRSAVGIGSWSPGRTAKHLEDSGVEESGRGENCNYYNQVSGKTPPAGGTQNIRQSREAVRQGAAIREASPPKSASMYENCSITEDTLAPPAGEDQHHAFSLSQAETVAQADYHPSSETLIQDLVEDEEWFHGRLGREQAESLLSCSGDFLVRESSSASGQYVLSGMEGATVKHLLLVDPNGQVRTCDQVFLSVGHLVRFHMESRLPIVSGSVELCLRQPVLQRH